MTYNYITLSQALQQIANRLYDPAQVFWTPAELTLYLQEALQTWNAMTDYWRGDFLFTPASGTTWYDLTNQTQMPNTLRPYTVTDADLYVLLQYHLLEPAVGVNPWTGVSAQFSAADLIAAVQRRRDEVLSTCGCTVTLRTTGAVAGRITLPDTVIDVRRIAYLPAFPGQVASAMWLEDVWGEQSFNVSFPQAPAGTPFAYLLSTEPPLSFDTDVPPAYGGQYELLTIEAGPLLSASTPTLLGIPDDWAHVIKWGALADLLSRESNAKDIPRAQYCNLRYQMGLKLLANAPALLALRMNNVVMEIDSVRAADAFNTEWEGLTPGPPVAAYQSGLNMLALSPVPDTGAYSATVTCVQNAPLPVNPSDPVQVSRDDLDVVIDYAQHLAAVKMGGAEFGQTDSLLKRFLKQASVYNSKLAELAEYQSFLYGVSQMEDAANPRMTPLAEEQPQ